MKIIMFIIISVILTGCTSTGDTSKDVVTQEPTEIIVNEILPQDEQDNIMKKYYSKLSDKNNEEEILKYIDENIVKVDTIRVDDMIVELEEYLWLYNTSLESMVNKLMKYYDYSSDEVKSYLNILDSESKNIFTDGENIRVELEVLLDRAIESEKHIRSYPTGKTRKRIQELYIAYIEGAIFGSGNQFVYADKNTTTIKNEVVEIYNDFIEKYKDSNSSIILSNYLEELLLDHNDLNGVNTHSFYDNLTNLIENRLR